MEIRSDEITYYSISFQNMMPGEIPILIGESMPHYTRVADELAKGAAAGRWTLPRNPFDYLALLAFHTLNYTIGEGTLLTDSLVCGFMGWIGRVIGLELRTDAPISPEQAIMVFASLSIDEAMEELANSFQRLVSAGLFGPESDTEAVHIVEVKPDPKKVKIIVPDYMKPNSTRRKLPPFTQ